MTKEEIRQEAEEQCNEEEYFRKNYPDSCYGDRPLSPYWDFFQDGVELEELAKIKEHIEIHARLEPRAVHITEIMRRAVDELEHIADLEETNRLLKEQLSLRYDLEDKIQVLEEQIKKMRCCSNCRYKCCSWTSETIKDGKRTSHYWNEEKQAYCDVGEGAESEYQLWEMRR